MRRVLLRVLPLILFLAGVDTVAYLGLCYVQSNISQTLSLAVGNDVLDAYPTFRIVSTEQGYKGLETEKITVAEGMQNPSIQRYSLYLEEPIVTRATYTGIFPTGSGVEEVAYGVTLHGDWMLQDGVDSTSLSFNGINLRTDFCVVPEEKRSLSFQDKIALCRDGNLQYVQSIVQCGADEVLTDTSEGFVDSYRSEAEVGYKILSDVRYFVYTTYTQINEGLLLTLRYYVPLECVNGVSFEELAEAPYDEWNLSFGGRGTGKAIVDTVSKITWLLGRTIGNITKIGYVSDVGTDQVTEIGCKEVGLRVTGVMVDVTNLVSSEGYDKIYAFDKGFLYLRYMQVSTDKINSAQRDKFSISMTSDLLNTSEYGGRQKLSDNIIRQIVGLKSVNGKNWGTLSTFIFMGDGLLQVNMVNLEREDTVVNLSSIVKGLDERIRSVCRYDS